MNCIRLMGRSISALLISLASFSVALSQEAPVLEGAIDVEGRSYNVNGNKARFHEYSDNNSGGIFGNVEGRYETPTNFVEIRAKDPGYDTQHYSLEARSYDLFKYWFDYNEIIHNKTFDAKTFYYGAGSEILLGAPSTNANTWADFFDYSTKRKRIGTGLSLDMAKPFFVNINYTHEQKEGTKVTGAATGNPGAASLELPEPVDYRTEGVKIECGYAKNPFFISLDYFYSEFKNGVEDLNFVAASGWTAGPFSLPPDNHLNRFSLKGSVKLPLNSRFSMNLSDASTKSETHSFAGFSGKVRTRNYDFTLTSNPLNFLDGKVYYKYYQRDNRSTGIFLSTADIASGLFYQTGTYGAELGFRLPAKLHLNTGYRYVRTDRKFVDEADPASVNTTEVLPYNVDNSYFADLKWTGIDMISAGVGYERLGRGADYRTPQSRAALNKKFAYAAQDRDTLKATVDISPADMVNLALEYRYKRTNYNDIIYGFTSDTRNAFSMNADYTLKKILRLYGYFDYEEAMLKQAAYITASPWNSKQEEKTYGYGLQADLYAIPKKLTFSVQYDYLRANGNNDFTFYDSAIWTAIGVPANRAVDIPNWDDYRRYTVGFSTTYNWSDAVSIRAGYTYARYIFSDAQTNYYRYVSASGAASNQAYLTGANAKQSYSANMVSLGVTYRF
jgi:MtrB/PioB family decaheme-associated outer membrane protein